MHSNTTESAQITEEVRKLLLQLLLNTNVPNLPLPPQIPTSGGDVPSSMREEDDVLMQRLASHLHRMTRMDQPVPTAEEEYQVEADFEDDAEEDDFEGEDYPEEEEEEDEEDEEEEVEKVRNPGYLGVPLPSVNQASVAWGSIAQAATAPVHLQLNRMVAADSRYKEPCHPTGMHTASHAAALNQLPIYYASPQPTQALPVLCHQDYLTQSQALRDHYNAVCMNTASPLPAASIPTSSIIAPTFLSPQPSPLPDHDVLSSSSSFAPSVTQSSSATMPSCQEYEDQLPTGKPMGMNGDMFATQAPKTAQIQENPFGPSAQSLFGTAVYPQLNNPFASAPAAQPSFRVSSPSQPSPPFTGFSDSSTQKASQMSAISTFPPFAQKTRTPQPKSKQVVCSASKSSKSEKKVAEKCSSDDESSDDDSGNIKSLKTEKELAGCMRNAGITEEEQRIAFERRTLAEIAWKKRLSKKEKKVDSEKKIACLSHNSISELFCRTENKVVCIKCVAECFASKHEVDVLEKVLEELRVEYDTMKGKVGTAEKDLIMLTHDLELESKSLVENEKKALEDIFDGLILGLQAKKKDWLGLIDDQTHETEKLLKVRAFELKLALREMNDFQEKYFLNSEEVDLIEAMPKLKRMVDAQIESIKKLEVRSKSISRKYDIVTLESEASEGLKKIASLSLSVKSSDPRTKNFWTSFKPLAGCTNLTNGGKTITWTGAIDLASGESFCLENSTTELQITLSADQYDGLTMIYIGLSPTANLSNSAGLLNPLSLTQFTGICFNSLAVTRFQNGVALQDAMVPPSGGSASGWGAAVLRSGDKFAFKLNKASSQLIITQLRDGTVWSMPIDSRTEYSPVLMLSGQAAGWGGSLSTTIFSIV